MPSLQWASLTVMLRGSYSSKSRSFSLISTIRDLNSFSFSSSRVWGLMAGGYEVFFVGEGLLHRGVMGAVDAKAPLIGGFQDF